MIVKYGLPKKLFFVKNVSNLIKGQVLLLSLKKNLIVPTAEFGEDGICLTCKYFEKKKKIDWIEREKQLERFTR